MKLPKKTSFYVWSAATLLTMAVIFIFSSIHSAQSDEISLSVTNQIFVNIDRETGKLSTPAAGRPAGNAAESPGSASPPVLIRLFGDTNMVTFVRKSAHVLVFAAMGFCAANALRRVTDGWKLFVFALVFTSFYAATDELHQYFVPGRMADVRDWALDTLGALAGIGIVMLHARHKSTSSKT